MGTHKISHKLTYSFICPILRVVEALEALESIRGVQVFEHQTRTTALIPDESGGYKKTDGIEITGTCRDEQMKKIIEALSEKGISGYSRETQVLFHPIGRDNR